MSERTLRCPRCGTTTNAADGKCPSCGLRVGFRRHSRRRDVAAAPRRRSRPQAAGRLEVSLDKLNESAHAQAVPPGPQPTQRYDIPAGSENERRFRQGAARVEAPKGGDVEVGTMANFLLDPSDDPNHSVPVAASGGQGDGPGLDLGTRLFGDEPEMPPEPSRQRPEMNHAAPPEPEFSETDAMLDQLEELAPGRPNRDIRPLANEQARKSDRNRHLLTRVLPQVVLLLVVLIVGPMLLPQAISLEGHYTAVFTDGDSREVTCATQFRPVDGEVKTVRGLFECKLYASLTSLDRVDEPHVLKPIMGDGTFAYTGQLDGVALTLKLGTFEPGEDRAVNLEAKVVDGGRRILGSMKNSLGNSAQVTMERPETE
jgi:hypothetical protein